MLDVIQGPDGFLSKLCMSIVVVLAIRRTFNFLRIFSAFSPIVTMLQNVIWKLRIFMTFYFILLLLISLMYGVLGVGNPKLPSRFRDTFWIEDEGAQTGFLDPGTPGIEYSKFSLLWGNVFQTIRISMGDFEIIAAADYLPATQNYLFWLIWLLTVILTCIIFLNFIVAEASNSYLQVSEKLQNYVQLQRADLVQEAEGLIPNKLKHERVFPKFIIIRKIEN